MIERRTQFNWLLTLTTLGLLGTGVAHAQGCDGVRVGRVLGLAAAYTAAEGTAFAIKHDEWWDTPTRSFKVTWDASANSGQDRLLHLTVGYHTAQLTTLAWRWACVPRTTAAWLGTALGIAVAIPKEIGDGVHEQKGFSGPDMLATAIGATIPALHQTIPATRIATLKFNYFPSDEYRNRTTGLPQIDNDYAGQRYYAAIVPGELPGGAGPWPDWLGVAVGHSVPHWISQPPINEWFVTLDLNAKGLPIKAPWWHKFAIVVDQFHIPLPGVRIKDGDLTFGLF
ncbi:MAG: DUF2279 domain-containing protein [Gemmatimonadales bacterium]